MIFFCNDYKLEVYGNILLDCNNKLNDVNYDYWIFRQNDFLNRLVNLYKEWDLYYMATLDFVFESYIETSNRISISTKFTVDSGIANHLSKINGELGTVSYNYTTVDMPLFNSRYFRYFDVSVSKFSEMIFFIPILMAFFELNA